MHRFSTAAFAAALLLVSTPGCAQKDPAPGTTAAAAPAANAAPATVEVERKGDRKVIKNAELELAADDPARVSREASSSIERHGGFVVSTDARRSSVDEASSAVVLRVPAASFGAAMSELRALGRVANEKQRGEDVTDESVDLAARLRAQRALEAQLLSVLQTAHTVKDALEVHRELGTVRTEIERLEGRQRSLDDKVAFSTISLTVRRPQALLVAQHPSVGDSVRRATQDFASVTLHAVHGVIRAAGVLGPFVVFLLLPALLVAHVVARRRALPA